MLLSIAAFAWLRTQAQEALEHRLQAQSREARDAIEMRLRAYADVLHGLSAFFNGSDTVSRADFRRYAHSLDLARRYPGLQLLSFTELVRHEERDAFERAVRQDHSLQPGGYAAFRIHPEIRREAYYVVKYIEPHEGMEPNLGFDLASDGARRAALERARDSGRLSASGRVLPASPTTTTSNFQLRMAVYQAGMPLDSVEQRRQAFLGVVGAGLNMNSFVAATLSPGMRRNLQLRIYDNGPIDGAPLPADPDSLLYDSANPDADAAMPADLRAEHLLEIGGRRWLLQVGPTEIFADDYASNVALPWTVLAAGLGMSLLMFALVHTLSSARGRAIALAQTMTQELRHSEAELAEAQRVARLGSWRFDVDTDEFQASTQAQRLLGAPALERLHPADRALFNQRLREAAADGAGFELELRLLPWSGEADTDAPPGPGEHAEQRWLHAIVRAERDATGRVRQLRGTLMDISERKHGELRLAVEHATTRILADSSDEARALQQLFHIWCETLDWQAAAHWQWDGSALRCTQRWCAPGAEASAVPSDTPGEWVQRAWHQREPAWTARALPDDAGAAAAASTPGALAVPVAFAGTAAGVLEFRRASSVRAPDAGLVALARTLGSQFGQFLQRRRAEQELLHAAHHDPLTGAINRNLFVTQLQHAIERSRRAQARLAVCFVDLDRFKAINDTLGHTAGDQLLRQMAARLRANLRRADLVARHGGDEFVVLAEDVGSPETLEKLARKLVSVLAVPYLVQGHECPVTGSVGVAVYPEDGQDAATLLRHADIAMYRAKEAGKNRYAFYAARMDAQAQRRLALQAALRRAVDRRELTLAYQPKIALADGRVTGVEALARWVHPEWGAISPGEFIPLAEDVGLIAELGRWVLSQALADAAAWHQRGLGPLRVAVNLSVSQFADGELLANVRRALHDSGAPPSLLELELTESMVMRDPEEAARLLQALRALGVQVSIDDFGTGHSSLAYLKRLPLDAVKLDRSFVQDLPDAPKDAAIATGVIALAQQLRLEVVAEGVETQAQRDFLRQAGCDQAQGYFFSRPLPAAALVEWLQAYRREGAGVEREAV
ncbi:bifunctional diguanylate cyclase/phosphodiesterase [Azohydromonas caseinilytica]|uniref:EAL domain-containing protein n=1 Tax=Azohydromonas caseinilytica TaxID=2728836 RepID=A0A848F9F9_9BURK|nr:EAL domain-containing protein [Azohydromonas caseinilytica]NML14651.1 EAL domain-containing protein [Azohydromonas caseinilytica]